MLAQHRRRRETAHRTYRTRSVLTLFSQKFLDEPQLGASFTRRFEEFLATGVLPSEREHITRRLSNSDGVT